MFTNPQKMSTLVDHVRQDENLKESNVLEDQYSLVRNPKIFDNISSGSDEKDEHESAQTVLVTGANGYLGSWIVYYLLKNKYRVKASVRDLENKESYQHLLDFEILKKYPHRLQIVEGRLEDHHVWVENMQGCEAVIHSASPNPYHPVKRDLEIIYPAVEGTLAILSAARVSQIKYFIQTGSLSNVRGTRNRKVYNEDVWGEIDGLSAYEQSKLLAERCAVFYNTEHGNFTQLTTLLPGTFFGPT